MGRLCISRPAIVAFFTLAIFLWLIMKIPNIQFTKVPPHFNWFQNITRNMSVYIKPEDVTTLLEPAEDSCAAPLHVLFIIPSSFNNTKERDAIRKTWGSWVTKAEHNPWFKNLTHPNSPRMKFFFLLGRDRAWPFSELSYNIREEQKLYGDLIVQNFVDSYTNLTLKSVFMLKWIAKRCPNASFIMKVDDDVFVTVPNLLKALKNKTSQKLLMGSLICNAKPIHNKWSKWFSPPYMFSEKTYPNYLSGTAYVLSGNLVRPLFEAALHLNYFHLEDVFITGVCAKKIGVKPTDSILFSYLKRPLTPCLYKQVISSHNIKSSDMLKLWKLLPLAVKCKPLKKSALRSYNPIKCIWK